MNAKEAEFEYATKAYSDLTGSDWVTLLATTKSKRYISIYNATNAAMLISFDASNTAFYLDANQAITPITGEAGFFISRPIYVKKESSSPTSGSVYLTVAS